MIKIIESYFQSHILGALPKPLHCSILYLSTSPVRFICLLACGVSCPCVSCMNNSWTSKAFAEKNHEQPLAQMLPSILYPVLITIIAPKLQSQSGSSYKYLYDCE